MRVAVLTPSLPERGDLLAEAVESVRAQSLAPAVHAIGIDYDDVGIGAMLNGLARGTDAEWLARLDDDDLLKPNHLAVLSARADEADIVYSWCEVAPVNGETPTPSVLGEGGWVPNQDFDADRLREGNYIPATALVRRSLWEKIGGWLEDGWGFRTPRKDPAATEDWDFWLRALDADARFVCVPEVTWTYRYHGGNLWFR
jgi:GT2 family glycosyltransferase